MKRHLGYESEEWSRLPWWKQRLYLEGLEQEFSDSGEAPGESLRTEHIALNGVPGELGALGFRETYLN